MEEYDDIEITYDIKNLNDDSEIIIDIDEEDIENEE